MGFSGGSDGKESSCNAGDPDLIPGSGRSPGEGNGYLLQYPCLENPMDRSPAGYSPWGPKDLHTMGRLSTHTRMGFPSGSVVNNLPLSAGDLGSILELGRCLGEGHGNPLQYSCWENTMDRGAWWTMVHGVPKSQTWLKWLSMPALMRY